MAAAPVSWAAPVAAQVLSIIDVTDTEGSSEGATDRKDFVFTLSLDQPAAGDVVVDYQILAGGGPFEGTATDAAGHDISGWIEWSSNISGSLDTGATVNVLLGPGIHTVTATVEDNGFTVTDAIEVVVVEPNHPPVATGDSYLAAAGHPLVVDVDSGILSNDTDPDGDTFVAILDTDVAFGTLVLSGEVVQLHAGPGQLRPGRLHLPHRRRAHAIASHHRDDRGRGPNPARGRWRQRGRVVRFTRRGRHPRRAVPSRLGRLGGGRLHGLDHGVLPADGRHGRRLQRWRRR